MQHFVILSQGAYSDYSPTYYMGPNPLSKEELDELGKKIGDECIRNWRELPEREHVHSDWCFGRCPKYERYNPIEDCNVSSPFDNYGMTPSWHTRMEEELTKLGFTKLPEEIPEINVLYNDYPSNLKSFL